MKNEKKMLTAITLVFLLVFLGVVIAVIRKQGDDGNAPQATTAQNKHVEPTITTTYDQATKKASLKADDLGNPAENTFLIKYIVTLKETGEKIYESDYIKPGESIEALEFEYDNAPGTYPVYLQREMYDPVTYKNHGGVMYTLDLVVTDGQ